MGFSLQSTCGLFFSASTLLQNGMSFTFFGGGISVDVGEDLDNDANTTASKPTSTKSSKSLGSCKESTTPAINSMTNAGTPSLDARARLGANLFLLSGHELGHVMTILELECPEVLESWGKDKVEINVDEIPPKVFASLNSYVTSKVGNRIPGSPDGDDISGSTKTNKKKRKSV